jgi:hypothetical protein
MPINTAIVHAMLTQKVQKKNTILHWQSSIVDLLKLLDLDSGLYGRKMLAKLLDVDIDAPGTA